MKKREFPVTDGFMFSAAVEYMHDLFNNRQQFTVTVSEGRKRSLDQNAISHAWYAEIARQHAEFTPKEAKRYCKLHLGVPILRAEDPDFRRIYDQAIKPLDYADKLIAMEILGVTSLMTTKQFSEYLEHVQKDIADNFGIVLSFPAEYRDAAA